MNTVEPSLVWEFHDAPMELQELSTNGGDEDWLIEVPSHYDLGEDEQPWFVGNMSERMYGCRKYPHPTKEGWSIFIISHA